MFTVRKELTPSANGDTKCSVYLQKKLDYEIHASYIMQIIAEVKFCKLGVGEQDLTITTILSPVVLVVLK